MTLKEMMKESKRKAKTWLGEHKGDIIYGCYIAACIGSLAAPIIRRSRKNIRDSRRGLYIYDSSSGFYWKTKREMTNNQKLIFEQRRKNGEPCGRILKDMNLLRK